MMDTAEGFVRGMDFDAFIHDNKTVFALVQAFEIMGEAAKNIPPEIREKYPQIPWKSMSGMRDKLIHAYFRTDLVILWESVHNLFPEIKPLVRRARNDLSR